MAYLTFKEIEGFEKSRLEKLYKRRVDPSDPTAPSFEEWKKGLSKSEVKQVGVVAVMNGDKILMGKRSDNGKWTNPGGHLEGKEKPKDGALRELYEEAGLEHDNAEKMFSKKVTAPDGVKLVVHAFKVEHDGQKPTSKNDPDKEVKKWEWIDTKNMPDEVKDNLHSPKNVILQKLGIIKAMIFDLIKATSHKYIRKYKRGSTWVYVYHEGEKKPRRLPPEAIAHLKELEELGDKDAKALLESMGEYSEPKLQLLRELADMGDEDAKKHLLNNHAIDRDQEKLEEAVLPHKRPEEDSTVKELTATQREKMRNAAIKAMDPTLKYLEGHATSQFSISLGGITGLQGLQNEINAEINSASNIKEALEKLNTIVKKIENKHRDLGNPSNGTIRDLGGYGNATYNGFVKELESKGLLPEGYSTVHQRAKGATTHSVPEARNIEEQIRQNKAREAQEKIAAEARAKAEAEAAKARLVAANAELFAKHGDSLKKMSMYRWIDESNGRSETLELNDAQRIHLMKGIEKFWGKDFKFDRFIENLQGHPDVQISPNIAFAKSLIEMGRGESLTGSISVSFTFTERTTNRKITRASRTINKKSDGSISWDNGCFGRPSNADLERYESMSKGLYAGVEKNLREITANYTGAAKQNTRVTIGNAANSGFGDGYKGSLVWAKHCFDWQGSSQKDSWKSTWNSRVDKYARAGLHPEDVAFLKTKIASCEYPEDFVRLGVKVTREQALKLTGRDNFDFDFNRLFASKGSMDLGDIIIIDSGTGGWGAENYIWKTTGRAGELNKRRATFYGWDNESPRGTGSHSAKPLTTRTTAPTAPTTPRPASSSTGTTSPPSNDHEMRARDAIRRMRPRTSDPRRVNISITPKRLRIMNNWPIPRLEVFLNEAPMTPAAKAKVRALLATMRVNARASERG